MMCSTAAAVALASDEAGRLAQIFLLLGLAASLSTGILRLRPPRR